MEGLKFNPTHRVLVKATDEDHGYHTISIDVNNGTFYRHIEKMDNTKIRVKSGVFAEKLGYNGNKDYHTPLTKETAQKVVGEFNLKRVSLGYEPVEFYRLENDN